MNPTLTMAPAPSPRGDAPKLTDPHGRWIRKLRVSLTDVCNFRCVYCMPANVRFQPSETLLPVPELISMVARLVDNGIRELRLTGGEPLARREFGEIVTGFSKLPIEKLGLTTNGFWLDEWLAVLAETICKNINISLDSLQPQKFQSITGTPHFRRVHDNILRAKEMGFNVKINTVLLKGMNDGEVEDFAAFSARYGIPVRFLEFMPIGLQRSRHAELYISAGDMIARLQQKMTLAPVPGENDATAFMFRTSQGGDIGFIASESRPFCGTCSRLRLTARGVIKACLMSEAGIDLKQIPLDEYHVALAKVLPMKPIGRIVETRQAMHEIGG